MKISTWNVNSVRARLENIKKYLEIYSPDILMLQEIKTEELNYPFKEFEQIGYFSHVSGQKSYNGVSILTKKKINNITKNLPGDKIKQARIISANIKIKKKNIDLINIYVPNGNPVDTDKYEYKKKWLDLFISHVEKKIKKKIPIIICGDFNVIPDEDDVYNHEKYLDDALFRVEIRKKYRRLINLGFSDIFRIFNKKKGHYTFWDYQKGSWQKNNGLRIDHILLSNDLIETVKKIEIISKIRNQTKPSDHVPVECTFN